MGTSSASSDPVAPEFLAAFRAAAAPGDTVSFERFMELALFDPVAGYYRRPRVRVGRTPGTDFFTAAHTGPGFGEMVAAACVSRLAGRDPRTHTFVEIGAEPGQCVLDGVAHPFGAVRAVRLADPLELSGPCVVFSNELFDAQPCRRTVFSQGRWHEIGVRLLGDRLEEVHWASDIAEPGSEGYRFDRPIAAARLAAAIAAQPWQGLFVAIDYGKTEAELREHSPGGTVRAYHRHRQTPDLLARPGEQDLTCHICWDWLEAALQGHGFEDLRLEFQESFFIRHAGGYLEAAANAEAGRLSARKLGLFQLLHPSQMGQKFQVLSARR
ncbi:MAG: SAM-dependent methyltransferase [Verrucomicrobia bacterium]|nr:SAM-dependent methyltransferase [Verrucomicrobiota bacterium]